MPAKTMGPRQSHEDVLSYIFNGVKRLKVEDPEQFAAATRHLQWEERDRGRYHLLHALGCTLKVISTEDLALLCDATERPDLTLVEKVALCEFHKSLHECLARRPLVLLAAASRLVGEENCLEDKAAIFLAALELTKYRFEEYKG